MNRIIYTPAKKVQIIHKVKDSKFYGSISSVYNEQDVKQFITEIKKKFHDASHNVSAYKLGDGDQALKYADDDGEPAASSGPPVLKAIEGEGLTNTVIVVTRYFGGTKLGIGGLVRAYGTAARQVIEAAGKQKLLLVYKLMVEGEYEVIGTIMGQIEAFQGKILSVKYNNNGAVINFLLFPEYYNDFKGKLIEMTANKVKINKLDEFFTTGE